MLLLVVIFVAQPFVVPSGSMENTLRPGDRLVVNKLAYQFGGTVHRGDVVVFDGTDSFVPGGDNTIDLGSELRKLGTALGLTSDDSIFVKRVIGVGGDRVTYRPGERELTVNGCRWPSRTTCTPGTRPPPWASTSRCQPASSSCWATTAAPPATPGTTSAIPAAASSRSAR